MFRFQIQFQQTIFMLIVLVVLGICGCKDCVQKTKDGGKKQVCTSFYLLADVAKKIVGDRMDIVCVMPVGSDVHGWEPTPRKVREMIQADAFLLNGAGLESWTKKVLPQLKRNNIPVFEAAHSVTLLGESCGCGDEAHDAHGHGHTHGHAHEHEHESCGDPHIWLSLGNMKKILTDMTKFFADIDPENAEFYRENLVTNLAECDALDAEFQTVTETLTNREIVVSHRAFGYLCRDYNLEQIALEGYSAYSDPSPAQMVKIVEFVREHKIPVIFTDSSESSKGAETIARETGVNVAVLHPMGTLTQEQIDSGADFFSVMRENLDALKMLK